MTSTSSKHKSPSTKTSPLPEKNKKASQTIVASPLAADNPPPAAPSTPTPADSPADPSTAPGTPAARSTPTPAACLIPTTAPCLTPQSPEPQGSEMLTAYLPRRLAFKEQALQLLKHSNEELVLEVEALQEQNRFFNTSIAELQQLANEVTFQ
jgi:hypothetical protein